jgi:hypothetical protein
MRDDKKTNGICRGMDYGHTMARFLILCCQIQIPIPNKYLEFNKKSYSFVEMMV